MIRRRLLRSEEHTSELQSHSDLVCRLLLEKKKKMKKNKKKKTKMQTGHEKGLEMNIAGRRRTDSKERRVWVTKVAEKGEQ